MDLTNIYAREGWKVWLREHPEWLQMRNWYEVCMRARAFRWNTWRVMNWYRVP